MRLLALSRKTIRRLRSTTSYICILLIAFASFVVNAAQANSLAVGPQAQKNPVRIPVNPPEFFNWRSRQEILNLRIAEIDKFKSLLSSPYEPNMSIFGAIEDGKPWWGLAGAALFGAGKRSIIGASEESRFVMNPYMLVGVNPPCNGIWIPNRVSEKDMEDRNFPFFWLPHSILMDPNHAREQVVYNIKGFMAKTAASGKSNGVPVEQFSLVAYNARDLGYNWIWLDTQRSEGVSNDNPTNDPVEIRQMIHCGGSCGYPGDCNNMSPFIPNIDRCRFSQLPARAVVYLWKERPASVKQAADFTVYIDFI